MAGPIVVFDLDGTLVDTAPDLLDSLNRCLDTVGLKRADPAELRRFIGFGARVMIERAFEAHGRALGDGQLDQLYAVFIEDYTGGIPGKSTPYPGVVAALDRLSASGYRLAVCTNKLEQMSKQLLAGLGIGERFAAICGQDTFPYRKPDPRHLFGTIEAAGGDVEQALMVGDSRTDIDTAKAAGIPVVAVDFGYSDQPVRDLEPSRTISHFDELTVGLARRLVGGGQGAAGVKLARA
ncbi:MAG: phosphoglycolate phosphatase [Hyphomicrobiales bacterium]|nr:phosphoglycolate phosphatase [Hyphomicrobiales bacterium]